MRRAAASSFLAAVLFALLATAAAPAAGAAELQVDPARSVLVLRVWKEGVGSIFAHDHVARASKLSGIVRWDPAHPSASHVEVTADADGIVMDEPNVRRRFGLPPIKDVDRRSIQKTMRGPQQLDVGKYPAITFRSRRVDEVGEGKVRIAGTFTLHGVSHEVTFAATIDQRGAYLHATGSFRFRQSEYGITPYSFGSTVRNQDEVELQVELLAK
jgi:polyisoprenoid-binding protein YceI